MNQQELEAYLFQGAKRHEQQVRARTPEQLAARKLELRELRIGAAVHNRETALLESDSRCILYAQELRSRGYRDSIN